MQCAILVISQDAASESENDILNILGSFATVKAVGNGNDTGCAICHVYVPTYTLFRTFFVTLS